MVYAGICGGLLFGIAGWYWYFGRHAAGGSKGRDEVLTYMSDKARSVSWYFTLAALLGLLLLEIIDLSMGTIPSLGILLFVHLGSWGLTSILLHTRMTRDPDDPGTGKMALLQGFAVGGAILILFAIISILKADWRFLLAAILSVMLGAMIMITNNKRQKGERT